MQPYDTTFGMVQGAGLNGELPTPLGPPAVCTTFCAC